MAASSSDSSSSSSSSSSDALPVGCDWLCGMLADIDKASISVNVLDGESNEYTVLTSVPASESAVRQTQALRSSPSSTASSLFVTLLRHPQSRQVFSVLASEEAQKFVEQYRTEEGKHDLQVAFAHYVAAVGCVENSRVWAAEHGMPYDEWVIGAFKALENLSILRSEKQERVQWKLSDEALDVHKNGAPESRVFAKIPKEGITRSALEELFGRTTVNIAWGKMMRARAIDFDKDTGIVKPKIESMADEAQPLLIKVLKANKDIDSLSAAEAKLLASRKMIAKETVKSFKLTKADGFTTTIVKPLAEVTRDLIMRPDWASVPLKAANIAAMGVAPQEGLLHALMQIRSEYREIFLELGFQEMETNQYVESSFWNYDSLFQPQQHPARDAHDTFFLADPVTMDESHIPQDYLKRVRETHENGGSTASIGWRYDWSLDEAKKNVLRTHTTSVSSRTLYKIAQGGFRPGKYFSIDRVYRNETLDKTHLAEFFQIEGFIVDRDLNLGHLMGIIRTFFEKAGVCNLKFKPAYNPYTEPSMEIFSYHSGLDEWVEIGNSGMFRPEMLEPMGMPENVRVIAWGFGLERPAMIKYGYKDIRQLCGSGYDLELANQTPLFRFGTEGHISAVQQAIADAVAEQTRPTAAASSSKSTGGAPRKGGNANKGKGKGKQAQQAKKPPAAAAASSKGSPAPKKKNSTTAASSSSSSSTKKNANPPPKKKGKKPAGGAVAQAKK